MDYGSYIDKINSIVNKKPKKKTQEQIFDKKKNKSNKTKNKAKINKTSRRRKTI